MAVDHTIYFKLLTNHVRSLPRQDQNAGTLANNPSFSNLSDKGYGILEGPTKTTHMI